VYPRSPDLSQTLPCSLHVTGGCSRIAGSCPIIARKRALSEWDKANPGAVYDLAMFRREILPRLGSVPLSEIMEAAGCSRRPRPTTGGGSGRRTCRRVRRWRGSLVSESRTTFNRRGGLRGSPSSHPFSTARAVLPIPTFTGG
jgi:hypothetical protein